MVARHDEIRALVDAGGQTRVMIVGEDEAHGELLSEILGTDGIATSLATSGEQAIELYQSYKPDIILMDMALSGMSGFQTARHIRDLYPEIFIPIIFVSSIESPESMVSCLESGGVDCLVKPYNPAVLSVKIQTFKEISKLYQTVRLQRDKLAEHTRYLESSYTIAEDVFNKVMQSDVLKSDAIKYILSPIAIFDGDILLAAYRPSGELHVMLGDFTGHGLSAAIGAIPVSEIFYGMTEKGFCISEIIIEINKKLNLILPRGVFLAACMIEYLPMSKKISVWNAGLPDVLIYSKKGNELARIPSKHYPLGINGTFSLVQSMDVLHLESGDRLLMFTDGLIEAKNSESRQYGIERVIDVCKATTSGWRIDSIYADLVAFVGDKAVHDDITAIEINLDAMNQPIRAKKVTEYPKPVVNAEWKMSFYFGPDVLRQVDPLPNLVQTLVELQKLHKFKQDIFVILKELFANAVDHGLLGLDSDVKSGSNGFSAYMQERDKRLAALNEGIISIEIIHRTHPEGGILDVYMYDSGEGFDVQAVQEKLTQDVSCYHGMGLRLVKKICDSLEISDKGNEIHARYIWRA